MFSDIFRILKFVEVSDLGDSCSNNTTQQMEVGIVLATPRARKVQIQSTFTLCLTQNKQRIAVDSSGFKQFPQK